MIEHFDFANKSTLAQNLAEAVATDLRNDIKTNGIASLAVSGGNTPKAFFASLAKNTELDWSKVTITLVDERWVDATSERSNARLVAQFLLCGEAEKAKFIPLYSGGEVPNSDLISQTNARLMAELSLPFSAVILGMGNDGHTASFFPKGDSLQAVLSEKGPALAINAPGAGEARVTLTLPVLLNTKNLYLHIEGPEKLQTLQLALAGNDVDEMPVRAVLKQKQKPVQIYWCP